MSHTIYAAKFEQTIIHQHVHLQPESQSHAPVHVLFQSTFTFHPIKVYLMTFDIHSGRHYCGIMERKIPKIYILPILR
jgi:hypothetical protein